VVLMMDAERPRRGEKFSGSGRRHFDRVGKAALSPFVAAVRKSPSIQSEVLRDWVRHSVTGGEAKRVALRIGIVAGADGIGIASPSSGAVGGLCKMQILS
jgi:hypothetical protein